MVQDPYRTTDSNLPLDKGVRAYQASVAKDPKYSGFNTKLLKAVKYISYDVHEKTTVFNSEVADFTCNRDGVLHGGALAVWFHRALPVRSVKLVCTVVEAGKIMPTVRAVMKTLDGKICSSI